MKISSSGSRTAVLSFASSNQSSLIWSLPISSIVTNEMWLNHGAPSAADELNTHPNAVPSGPAPHQCSAPLFFACSASCKCLVAAAARAVALSFWKSAATACAEGNGNTHLDGLLKVGLFSKCPSWTQVWYLLSLFQYLTVEYISYQQQILCGNSHCVGKCIIIFILHKLLWICSPNFYLEETEKKRQLRIHDTTGKRQLCCFPQSVLENYFQNFSLP